MISRRAPGRAAEIVGGLDDHRLERGPVDVHVVRRHGHHHRFAFAVLARKSMPILESACPPSRDRSPCRYRGRTPRGRDMRVQPDFARHDPRQAGHLGRVRQDVLAITGAVAQTPHQAADVRMQIVQSEVERDGFALLAHRLVGLVLHLLDDFLDPRGVNAAVRNETLDGLLGDLAAVGVEAGQDDGARRVVHDEIDAGGHLEGADVAALSSDDPALEIVAWQVDDRHGGFDGVLAGAALNGLGDVVLRAVHRRFARFGVEALQQVGRFVAGLIFDLLDQEFLGFVRRQARDALELVLLTRHQIFVFLGGGGHRRLAAGHGTIARGHFLLDAVDHGLAIVEQRLALGQRLLERNGLLTLLAGVLLGRDDELVRLLLGGEERLFLERLGVAFGLLGEARSLLFGAADGVGGDAFAARHPEGEHTSSHHQRDGQIDDVSEYRKHA